MGEQKRELIKPERKSRRLLSPCILLPSWQTAPIPRPRTKDDDDDEGEGDRDMTLNRYDALLTAAANPNGLLAVESETP